MLQRFSSYKREMQLLFVAVSAGGGGEGGVWVRENKVNIEGLLANKNECSVASWEDFSEFILKVRMYIL